MKNPVNLAKNINAAIFRNLEQTAELSAKLDSLERHLSRQDADIETLKTQSGRLEKLNDLYFWALFKHSNELDLDSRKRFFQKLPQADGDNRLLQEGDLKLFSEFHELCQKHQLTYWMDGGTLLGAERHKGFIPWDDDIDVYMPREDISKLQILLKNDPNFRITIVYSTWNANKEVRFRTTNPDNPCYIDLFICDYGNQLEADDWKKYLQKKQNIIDELQAIKNPEAISWRKKVNISIDNAPELIPFAERFFDSHYGGIHKSVIEGGPGGVMAHKTSKTKVAMWALDNLLPIANRDNSRIYDCDDIFPLKLMNFEGRSFFAPKNHEKILTALYGDYYQIPKDLTTHYRHVAADLSSIKAVKKYLGILDGGSK